MPKTEMKCDYCGKKILVNSRGVQKFKFHFCNRECQYSFVREKNYYKNDYEIKGDVAIIYIDHKNGDRSECLVDIDDLERIISHPYKWTAEKRKWTTYVKAVVQSRSGKRIKLHRFIMNPDDDKTIDHINGNGLDNRKKNLRICTIAENNQNLKTKKNNKIGIRGVCWNKRREKWQASVQVGGKEHRKMFSVLEEASAWVAGKRKELMPYSVS